MSLDSGRQNVVDALWGVETEWLAIDRGGHVGLMSTAGRGPIPGRVLDQLPAVAEALTAISDLPLRGQAIWIPSGSDVFDVWLPWARRGFFAWDWALNDYSIIARPTVPVLIDELAVPALSKLARLTAFSVDFEDSKGLATEDAEAEWFWPRPPADRD